MNMRAVLIVGFLGLTIATVTLARQQPGDSARPDQTKKDEPRQLGIAEIAALRAGVARLRAEVELLAMEHEANKTVLLEALKEQLHADSATEQAAKAEKKAVTTIVTAASYGRLDEIKQEFGNEEGIRRVAEKEEKELAESGRAEIDRKKQAFLKQTVQLHEKTFLLNDLERQLSSVK